MRRLQMKLQGYVLIALLPFFAISSRESRDADFDGYYTIASHASLSSTLCLVGTGDGTDDFRVADLEVGGAVCGWLDGDGGGETTQLVPAPPIEAQEREGIGGCVEWHFERLNVIGRVNYWRRGGGGATRRG